MLSFDVISSAGLMSRPSFPIASQPLPIAPLSNRAAVLCTNTLLSQPLTKCLEGLGDLLLLGEFDLQSSAGLTTSEYETLLRKGYEIQHELWTILTAHARPPLLIAAALACTPVSMLPWHAPQ